MARQRVKERAFREPIHPDAPGFDPARHKDLVAELNDEVLPSWVTDVVGPSTASPDTHQLRLSALGTLEYWSGSEWRSVGSSGSGGSSAPESERLPRADPAHASQMARVRADGAGWEHFDTPLSRPVTPSQHGRVLGIDGSGQWALRTALAPSRREIFVGGPVPGLGRVTHAVAYGQYVYGLEVLVESDSTGDVVVRIFEDEAKTRLVYDGLFPPGSRADRAQAWFFIHEGAGTAWVEIENRSGGAWNIGVRIRGVQFA